MVKSIIIFGILLLTGCSANKNMHFVYNSSSDLCFMYVGDNYSSMTNVPCSDRVMALVQ